MYWCESVFQSSDMIWSSATSFSCSVSVEIVQGFYDNSSSLITRANLISISISSAKIQEGSIGLVRKSTHWFWDQNTVFNENIVYGTFFSMRVVLIMDGSKCMGTPCRDNGQGGKHGGEDFFCHRKRGQIFFSWKNKLGRIFFQRKKGVMRFFSSYRLKILIIRIILLVKIEV